MHKIAKNFLLWYLMRSVKFIISVPVVRILTEAEVSSTLIDTDIWVYNQRNVFPESRSAENGSSDDNGEEVNESSGMSAPPFRVSQVFHLYVTVYT